jgi:prepilin-type N-terminal cleavage/methylation domain-containing protein
MRDSEGFSLIELLVVVALMATVAAIAAPITTASVNRTRSDSAVVTAGTVIEAARNRAIAERRNIQITFAAPNRITVSRVEIPGPALTVVEDVQLSEGMSFTKFPSVPDTPDAFGAASAVQFTGPGPVMFTSDGSLIDTNGDVVNASIFMGRGSDVMSARAFTIFGVTGYVRMWAWGGGRWIR